MASPETKEFLQTVAPFNQLAREEFARVAEAATLERYTPGETVQERLAHPAALFVIAAGVVEESDLTGSVALYAAGSCFDAVGLINGRSENSFAARDQCLCYQLPAPLFHALARSNSRFHDHFHRELQRRQDALVAVQQQREASSFLLARLGEGVLHPPVFVEPETTIREAAEIMQSREITAVLVRRGAHVGIFTERDVRERSLLMRLPETTPIGDLASYDLQTLDHESFLFSALMLMTERSIRHVVVTRNGAIEGVFEQADLLSYLSNSSYVIASRIDRAQTPAELQQASAAVTTLIRSLFHRGVKPRYIARIVTDLNRKLFRRVFEDVTPPAVRGDLCLIVMGSEGRGEQLLRTDQDNGLIFRGDPLDGERQAIAEPFTRTLIELGYPPCPGEVMVSNPEWSKSSADYRTALRGWLAHPTGDALLRLAILYDASAVAGDPAMLVDLKTQLFELLGHEEAFTGHFARATLTFPTPLGLFNRFVLAGNPEGRGIDIKKGGIFPIVHGVRSLALEYRVTETSTIARMQALSGRGPFSEEFTADLIEAFDFMCMIRLREQLASLDAGGGYDNVLDIERLRNSERNLLRESLKVVRQFKSDVTHHFRLNMLG